MNSKDSEEPRRVNRRHAIDKHRGEAYPKTPLEANGTVKAGQICLRLAETGRHCSLAMLSRRSGRVRLQRDLEFRRGLCLDLIERYARGQLDQFELSVTIGTRKHR